MEKNLRHIFFGGGDSRKKQNTIIRNRTIIYVHKKKVKQKYTYTKQVIYNWCMYIKWHGTMLINPIKSGAPQKSWCSWLAPLEIYKKKSILWWSAWKQNCLIFRYPDFYFESLKSLNSVLFFNILVNFGWFSRFW